MNTFSHKAALRLVVPAIALLAAGCAAGPHKVAQTYYADDPQVWYPRIRALPVDGQLPSATQAETISGVAYGVAGDPARSFGSNGVGLYATRRVVAYVRDPVPAENLTIAQVASAIDQAKAERAATLPQPAAPIPMY